MVCPASVPDPPSACDIRPRGITDQRAGHCADRPQHDRSGQGAESGVTDAFLRLRGDRQQQCRNSYNNQFVFHTDPHLDLLTVASDIGNKAVGKWRSPRVPVARPADAQVPSGVS
jgi:hypothetical protein